MPPHSMAGPTLWGQLSAATDDRFRTQERQIKNDNHPKILVRPHMGSNSLYPPSKPNLFLRHGRLWVTEARMRRRRRCAAHHARGVHSERRRGARLLRREFGRRVQSSDARCTERRPRRGVRRHWVSGGLERSVSSGVEGGS